MMITPSTTGIRGLSPIHDVDVLVAIEELESDHIISNISGNSVLTPVLSYPDDHS